MPIECFLDTNVLIYAATAKQDEPRKFAVADQLLSEKRFGLSAQVLAEFFVNYTRKPMTPPTTTEVDGWMDALRKFPVVSVDETLVRTAIVLARQFQIHYYDAAIIAAAERLGAPILYTEDLNHGQHYGSVQVRNPFRDP